MSTRVAGFPARRISCDEAAGLVKSGMWLDYSTALCQPDAFDRALAARRDSLESVKIRSCLTMRPRAVVESDPAGRHFCWFSWHFSGYDRKKHDCGCCNYIPLNLGEVPDYYRRFLNPVDMVIFKACPMDADGYFNFGPTNMWHRAIIERARTVIVEVTNGLPYACGVQNSVHANEVDYIIAGDDQEAPELANPAPDEVDRSIARQIAPEIEDGSCVQVGIGGLPNAVCTLLVESGVRDLGCTPRC